MDTLGIDATPAEIGAMLSEIDLGTTLPTQSTRTAFLLK